MRWKDLAVGKYVTNNRYLCDYWRGNDNLMKIIELPKGDNDKLVACQLITNHGYFSEELNGYDHIPLIFVPYIHLHEIKEKDSFRSWKVGDIIFPTEFGMKNDYALRKGGLYLITNVEHSKYNNVKRFFAKKHGSQYERPVNPIYFTKSDAIKVWNGIFANQYYNNQIRVEDGELIVPKEIKVDSPVYNQILKEAKACGVI